MKVRPMTYLTCGPCRHQRWCMEQSRGYPAGAMPGGAAGVIGKAEGRVREDVYFKGMP